MTLLVMLLTTATAWAEQKSFNYLKADGTTGTETATVLTNETDVSSSLPGGWYVVEETVSYSSTLCFTGETHLILADDAAITINGDGVENGIYVDGSLTIYAQSTGDNQGTLSILSENYDCEGGILAKGDLKINGGTVNVTSPNAAIHTYYGNIIINGGDINANSSIGIYAEYGDITINGGIINANGTYYNGILASQSLTINGGTVTATSEEAYCIGANENIFLNGGNVTANSYSLGIQAGINNTITFAGAIVTASSFSAGTVKISNGMTYTDGTNPPYDSSTTSSTLTALTNVTLWPDVPITYINALGVEKTCTKYTPLTNGTDISSGLNAGWYVIKGNVNYNDILHFKGDTHLILADDAHLTISRDGSGIAVNEDGIESNLTIYAQSTGNNKGKVTIEAVTGIWVWNGSLTINGGDIIANGYDSGIDITYGGIIINGGTINVSGTEGYGICTSTYDDDTNCDIIINGGEVNATTDEEDGENGIYTEGKISINGGSVIANGSTNGIESGGDITITGGNITATSKYMTGIYSYGDIIINNGIIIASGNSYGIATSSQDIYINGGTVSATGTGESSNGVYGNLSLAGGTIYASSYYGGLVTVASGLTYSDGNSNTYTSTSGTNGDISSDISGKTLHPIMESYTLTASLVDGNYWTTFYCGDGGYSITNSDAYAYTATYHRIEGKTNEYELTLNKLGEDGKNIPQSTAVIIVSSTASVSLTKNDGLDPFSGSNSLHGVDVRTDMSTLVGSSSDNIYVMGKKGDEFGFFKYTADYMPARKAFLLIDGSNEALARGITMVFENSTGIKSIDKAQIGTESDAWYSLDGRKLMVKPTTKGVYINNGNKVVIK